MMANATINSACDVARFLKSAGYHVTELIHGDEYGDADASLTLAEGLEVQVGEDYFMIYEVPTEPDVIKGRLIAQIEGTNLSDLMDGIKVGLRKS